MHLLFVNISLMATGEFKMDKDRNGAAFGALEPTV